MFNFGIYIDIFAKVMDNFYTFEYCFFVLLWKIFRRSSEGFLKKFKEIFKDKSSLVFSSIEDVCEHIFQHDSSVSEIDITIRLIKDDARILFIDDGELYNPFNSEELLESQNIKRLQEINCEFEYTNVLGFNKPYLKLNFK